MKNKYEIACRLESGKKENKTNILKKLKNTISKKKSKLRYF